VRELQRELQQEQAVSLTLAERIVTLTAALAAV
jgi:hypothetical protein